jgi:hypothetical protein
MLERENALDSIRFNNDGDLNEIVESDAQFEKLSDPRISTGHGIVMDSSFDHENALDSIRFNDDGDSNEIDDIKSWLCSIVMTRIPLITFTRRIQLVALAPDICSPIERSCQLRFQKVDLVADFV